MLGEKFAGSQDAAYSATYRSNRAWLALGEYMPSTSMRGRRVAAGMR